MRPQVLLVTLAVLAVLAALPLTSNGSGEKERGGVNIVDGPGGVNIVDGPGGGVNIVDDAVNMRTWPCCDQCGVCNRKNPPECQCMDFMFQGCHPRCRNCIKYVSSREPPVYRCGDNVTNFCRRRCSPTGPI